MLRDFLKRTLKRDLVKQSGNLDGEYKNHLYALILAGGGGTRLWPRSRNNTPKQFLKLFNNKTLTQVTAQRFSEILPWKNIYVVTVSSDYKREIENEVPQIPKENIIVEPQRRETGPAHGLGAAYIYKKDPNAVILTEAADRLVKPTQLYLKTLKAAAKVAYEKKLLIALGVEARYPHTGLGHIKRGKKFTTLSGINFYKLEKFVEKPALDLAKKYTSSGEYYWNAGEFVWRADAILDAIKENAPDIWERLKIISNALSTKDEKKIIEKEYKDMPKISIDYAVAEKAKNFVVVEGTFFWTDIGDWKEVWENLPKDENGNVIISEGGSKGRVINLDTSDALVHTDGRLIALVDVDNLVVVDTKDALLICPKSKAQSVKKIVEQLKEEKIEDLL